MNIIFLASKSDEIQLNEYFAKIGYDGNNIIYDKAFDIKKEHCDLVVIAISPVSADSSMFQAAVLETFQNTSKNKIMRIRLEDIDVPVGFGVLCDLEDWRP
jgi:hypothetical protein